MAARVTTADLMQMSDVQFERSVAEALASRCPSCDSGGMGRVCRRDCALQLVLAARQRVSRQKTPAREP